MVMRILTKDENQAIKEEIDTLDSNIETVANILANDKNLPYLTGINAEKLLSTFIKIKNHLLDKNANVNNKLVIIQKLPLLYLQIHKIGVSNDNN